MAGEKKVIFQRIQKLGLLLSKSYIQLGKNKIYAIILPELLQDRYESFKTDKSEEEIDMLYNNYGLKHDQIKKIEPDTNPLLVTIYLKQ